MPADDSDKRHPDEMSRAAQILVFQTQSAVDKFLTAVHKRLESRLRAGEDVPGLKLVNVSREIRSWSDPEIADAALRTVLNTNGPEARWLEEMTVYTVTKIFGSDHPFLEKHTKLTPGSAFLASDKTTLDPINS